MTPPHVSIAAAPGASKKSSLKKRIREDTSDDEGSEDSEDLESGLPRNRNKYRKVEQLDGKAVAKQRFRKQRVGEWSR